MHRLRASLLVVVGLAFGVWLLAECWSALQSGVISVPLGRRRTGVLLTLLRGEQPVYFFLALVFGGLVALAVFFGAFLQGRSLVTGSSSSRAAAARTITAQVEQAAPSGLAPLWWGLLIVAVCVLIYAAA